MPILGSTPDWHKLPQDLDITNGNADITPDEHTSIRHFKANDFTIRLTAYDPKMDSMYGIRGFWLYFTGTGTNGEPTGSIVINANAIAAKTVNGGSTVTYTALKAPLLVFVSCDPTSGNFTAVQSRTLPTPGTTLSPTSGAVLATIETQVNNIISRLQGAGIIL